MRTLRFGGQLSFGDFVAISYGNHLDFGWYVGNGIGGTLQYYSYRGPGTAYEDYQLFLDGKLNGSWKAKRYEKGFTTKCLWKSYINSVHSTRVMKITNPEEIFTNKEDRDIYQTSKEALITLNFIQK